jgi:hypothetical protein
VKVKTHGSSPLRACTHHTAERKKGRDVYSGSQGTRTGVQPSVYSQNPLRLADDRLYTSSF